MATLWTLDPLHFIVPGVLPPNVAVEPILVSLDLAVDGTCYSFKVHPPKVEMTTWKTLERIHVTLKGVKTWIEYDKD